MTMKEHDFTEEQRMAMGGQAGVIADKGIIDAELQLRQTEHALVDARNRIRSLGSKTPRRDDEHEALSRAIGDVRAALGGLVLLRARWEVEEFTAAYAARFGVGFFAPVPTPGQQWVARTPTLEDEYLHEIVAVGGGHVFFITEGGGDAIRQTMAEWHRDHPRLKRTVEPGSEESLLCWRDGPA